MADPIKENSDVVMKTTYNNGNDIDNGSSSMNNNEVEVEAFLKKCNTKNENKNNNNNILNTPGKGWSNGDIRPEMFPLTRNGKLQLYSGTRRWIGLNKGWSRVGGDEGGGKVSNEYSHRTCRSSKMGSLLSTSSTSTQITSNISASKMLDEEALAVRSLIAQLCEQYYKFGWATGTGGGVSIRVGGPSENRPWRVFVAPSGIQKGKYVISTINKKKISVPLSFLLSENFANILHAHNLTRIISHSHIHIPMHITLLKNRGYDR